MPKNYQAVQAGHAVAQYMLDYPDTWRNQTLIYLRVTDLEDLDLWNARVAELGHETKFACFIEPDMDDQMTAMAVLSKPEVDELFCRMRLI